MNESSEAEEINGVIDSDEEKYFLSEASAMETPKLHKPEMDSALIRKVKPGIRSKKKPGKRIKTIIDSDDEFGEPLEDKVDTWCQTYNMDNLPTVTFSFGIQWQPETEESKEKVRLNPERFLSLTR